MAARARDGRVFGRATTPDAGGLFPRRTIVNTLGEWVAAHGLRQFRMAETEKYPHVTFFLNGGARSPSAGEERYHAAVARRCATYDLQPEMSAAEVTDAARRGDRGGATT